MYIILLLKEQEISSNCTFCSHNQASVSPCSKVKRTIFSFRFRIHILAILFLVPFFTFLLRTAKMFHQFSHNTQIIL